MLCFILGHKWQKVAEFIERRQHIDFSVVHDIEETYQESVCQRCGKVKREPLIAQGWMTFWRVEPAIEIWNPDAEVKLLTERREETMSMSDKTT